MESDANEAEKSELFHVSTRGVAFKFGSTAMIKFLGIIFQILILRYLVTEEASLYLIAYTMVMTISSLATLGLGSALMRFIPMHLADGKKETVKIEIWSSTLLLSALGIIAIAIAFAFPGALVNAYMAFAEQGAKAEIVKLIPLEPWIALFVLVVLLQTLWTNILDALKMFEKNAYIQAGLAFVKVVLTALLIFTGYKSAEAVLGASLGAYLFSAAIMGWMIRENLTHLSDLKNLPAKFASSVSIIAKNLAFGLPVFLSSMMDSLTTNLDILMLGLFFPLQVAAYSAAVIFVRNIGPFVFGPINSVAAPLMAEWHVKKTKVFDHLVKESSRWTAYLGIPVIAIFLIYSRALFGIVIPKYVESSSLIWYFAPMAFFTLISSASRNALFVRGHVKMLALISIVILAMNASLNYILIPKMGMSGAAIATSVSVGIGEIIAILAARMKAGARLHYGIWISMLAGAIMVLTGYIALPYFGALSLWAGKSLLNLIIGMSVSCIVYSLALLLMGGIGANDWKMGMQFLKNNGLEKYVKMVPFSWNIILHFAKMEKEKNP